MSVRLEAAKVLAALLRQEGSLATQLPGALKRTDPRDQPLLQELCYGVCRYHPALQALLNERLSKAMKAKDADIQALLLLGLYQLRHTRIPAHAAIAETVSCCQKLRKQWAKGLVNAVLRGVQRQSEPETAVATSDRFRLAHPDWLIGKVRKAWPQQAESILLANNQPGPMTLRVNQRRCGRDDYLDRLQSAGIEALACRFAAQAVQLKHPCDVHQLPGFDAGDLSVQDEAAQLAAALLDPQAGDRVLDACAAPGGKTAHLLEHQPELAELQALELNPNRLPRIQDTLQRLGLQAEVIAGDASSQSWWDGKPFDRILADVPCSATGVIRRNPDIKLLRQPEEINSLSQLQSRILDNLWQLLKPGGRLLYATCSVLPTENEAVVASFIHRHADACELPIEAPWGVGRPVGRQLFPQPDGHDGFYYALLVKTGD